MTDASEAIFAGTRKRRQSRLRARRVAGMALLPVIALIYDTCIDQFFAPLAYLKLAFLVTMYMAISFRSEIKALSTGMGIGLMQDLLSSQFIGVFGIAKTLVGYFTAYMCLRFDVDRGAIRFVLVFFFFVFHEVFYWILVRALLGQPKPFNPILMFLEAALNAVAAVPLFLLLDKMKGKE